MKERFQISKNPLKILRYIHDQPGRSMSELSRKTNINLNSVWEFLIFFEEQKWIQTNKPGKERLSMLTPKGENALIAMHFLVKNELPQNVQFIKIGDKIE